MKAFSGIMFLLFLHFNLVSQEVPGFNKRFSGSFQNATIYKLLIENDTIVTMGSMRVDTATWGNGIVLSKFDSSGNLLHQKLIVDPLIGQVPIELRFGNFQSTPDGGYIMSISPYLFEYPILLKTDHEFNVDFFKTYDDTTGYNYQVGDFTPISDGYLMFGLLNWNDNDSDGYVRKINFEGETVWVKYFGNLGKDDSVLDVEVVNDTSYMVAMGHNLAPNSGNISLRAINNDGVQLNYWQSEMEPNIGYIRDVISIDESGILIYGLAVKGYIPIGWPIVQSTISKLDNDFSPIAVNNYGNIGLTGAELMFYGFEKTIDGNYIGVGRTSISQGDTVEVSRGWLMKFSPNGDSIWSRQDVSDLHPEHFLDDHRLGSVGILSSGNIIAGGYAEKWPDSYIWLIKATNDGCIDTLYCGLVSGAAERREAAGGGLLVYPNPAASTVQLVFGQAAGDARVSCLDAHGRLVRAERLPAAGGQAGLSVEGLPAGLYFLRLEIDGRQPIFAKLEIVR